MLAEAKEKLSRNNHLDNHSIDIEKINEAIEQNLDESDEDQVVPAQHYYQIMVKNMMTITPRASFLSFNKKTKKTKELSMILPKRLPSFNRVLGLNNHYFEVNGEEYEFVDGRYYKKT